MREEQERDYAPKSSNMVHDDIYTGCAYLKVAGFLLL